MKSSHTFRPQRTALAIALLTAGAALPASADLLLEEVTVTAQKREQNLQDVGIAVTAFTGNQLEELGIEQAVDLAQHTPGLEIRNTVGNSNPVIAIRGIGLNDYHTNNAPSAAVHIDEVYLGSNGYLSFQMFDMERVEVLKGPQGTLFGRNTTAGSVNFITNKPTSDFEAYAEIDYGNFNTLEMEAAVGGAMADNINGRFAVKSMTSDGHQKNMGTGAASGFTRVPGVIPPNATIAPDDDWGGSDVLAWRGSVDWQAGDTVDVSMNLHGSRDKSEQWGYAIPDGEPLMGFQSSSEDEIFLSDTPNIDADQLGGFVKVDWDLGGTTLTSLTGYESLDRQMLDSDGSPLRILDVSFNDDLHQMTQELRLTSADDSAVQWIGGIFWMTEEVDFDKTLNLTDLLLSTATIDYVQTGDSWAVFGQAEWHVSDAVKLTAGLRYTEEDKRLKGETRDNDPYGISRAQAVAADPLPIRYDRSYQADDISGKIALDWMPTDSTLIYASISKGFKSGGFDGSTILDDIATLPFSEEILWSYETGFKSTLVESTLQLTGALYYYDFDDMQAEILIELPGGLTETIRSNAGKVEITGGELELVWAPLEGLDIKTGLSMLDGSIEQWNSPDPDEVAMMVGNSVPNAPETSFNVLARYEWDLSAGLSMAAVVDYTYSDTTFLTLENDPDYQIDDYDLVGARLQLSSTDETWSAALWGRNLADERFATNYRSTLTQIAHSYNFPRSYGVNFQYHW
ncbi:TonB-dependent receptor [Microbulbifer pacificus]|uniref:TonB-dependent receptor n=1 Tax=Microbulbifer pacificus TaxID=407164 RepID=A0AAU0N0B0_9GAMM|nr:TonB-dependent receptor [Microbulbifer pacificus]WOX05104.1 TonB-dependent receptor [Microbulbifer pacificus]